MTCISCGEVLGGVGLEIVRAKADDGLMPHFKIAACNHPQPAAAKIMDDYALKNGKFVTLIQLNKLN